MELTPSDPQTQDDVALSLRQFSGAWRLMCAEAPGAVTTTADGVEYIFSGIPIGFFNVALVTPDGLSAEALTALGRQACAWAAGHDVPWMFVVTHERVAAGVDAAQALQACGLAPVLPLTGMRATALHASAGVPDGLTLGQPDDDAGCRASIDINTVAYGMDLEASKPVLGRQAFWQDQVLVVGTADGTPASSAAVLWVDGLRYVALVATDPAFQRRGFAEATMRRALDVAASTRDASTTVLHATAAGRPVYERMGYDTISNHTIFMEQRFLEGH